MRRMIVTIGGLAMGAWIAGCAPAYVESRPAHPVYGPNYGYGYGGEYRGDGRHERHEAHEAREHEEHEEHEHGHDGWRAPEDHD
jgi:hypothetical protein